MIRIQDMRLMMRLLAPDIPQFMAFVDANPADCAQFIVRPSR